MAPDDELSRFLTAQDAVLAQVEQELALGRKRSHWMWFIFPQLVGLGKSTTARFYGIENLEQARRYLGHPVLGARLRRHAQMVMSHTAKSAQAIFGHPDDLKFCSCLTLFAAASSSRDDAELFASCLRHFYAGRPDPQTLQLLQR